LSLAGIDVPLHNALAAPARKLIALTKR